MRAASRVSSAAITACSCFPTRTRTSSARSRSISTRCDLPRASCGANTPRRATSSISTCGMTTLSASDSTSELDRFSALPRLPRDGDDGGPVFAEPWQAQAFALAVKLSEAGHFTWKEWAATLAAELRAAEDRGEPDDGSHYYEHWVAALER